MGQILQYGLLPADLIFTHSDRTLGKLIQWAERASHEIPTYANHVAIINENLSVVEALNHVKCTPWPEWVGNSDNFQIWRLKSLNPVLRNQICVKANSYIGRDYGYLKLLAHFGDGLFRKLFDKEVYFFRRLAFMDKYPICSWVASFAYASAGIKFGCAPEFADPDMMCDFVQGQKQWSKVSELFKSEFESWNNLDK